MPKALTNPELDWINAERGKHFCKCGCGQSIKINRQHRYARGIPEYVDKTHRMLHWIKQNQGKHFCQCGCEQPIEILPQHRSGRGISKYIKHHHAHRKIVDKWIEENQNKHICACGCGRYITVHEDMKYKGIAKFIHGHSNGLPIDMWVRREQGKYICACGCGNKIKIRPDSRKRGIPKYIHGHNSRGKSNPSWKGGITDDYRKRRNAYQLEDWRRRVLERDDFQCRMPGCRTPEERRLCAHHIVRFIDDESLATDVWNGITLCETCHYSIKGREQIYEAYFQDILEFERLGIA